MTLFLNNNYVGWQCNSDLHDVAWEHLWSDIILQRVNLSNLAILLGFPSSIKTHDKTEHIIYRMLGTFSR
jgi:hypothetical protein